MAQVNVSKDTAAIQALYEAVTRSLASGQSPQAVARRLIKRGMPPEPANRLVAEASAAVNVFQKSPEGRRAMVKRYQGRMIRGLLWAVGGLLVTAITYSMASGRGGTYYIFWGAVLFGAIDFFAGFLGWLRYQSEI